MWRTLPDRAQSGLHLDPLDVAIGQLLAPYCPGVSVMIINGGDTTNTQKKLLVLWHYAFSGTKTTLEKAFPRLNNISLVKKKITVFQPLHCGGHSVRTVLVVSLWWPLCSIAVALP